MGMFFRTRIYTAQAVAVIFLAACGLKSSIVAGKVSSVSSSASSASLQPMSAKPGEMVTITGTKFDKLQRITVIVAGIDGVTKTVPATFVSESLATFLMPQGLGLGLKSATLAIQGKEMPGALRIVADDDANTLPIIIDEATEICSTKTYIDKTGAKAVGTKNCAPVAATVADCTADGAIGCKTVAAFPAANAAAAVAGNIKTGVSIGGISGSFSGSFSNCSTAGEQSCIAAGTYFAGTACAADASNCFLPTYAVATQPLKAISFNAIDPAKMLDSLTLSGVTGTVVSRGSWALTAAFPGAGYYTGISAAPTAGTMLTGTTVNAVAGTATAAPAVCSTNGVTGCVTTSTYQSGDLTNLTEGNIKNGTTIAGVAGLYPNATYKLPSAGGAAVLTNATLDAKVKSATAFELWTEAGAREQSVGDADITAANIANGVSIFGLSGTLTATAPNAWDVRVGTTINGVLGKLKVNCRNGATLATFDQSDYPKSATVDITANTLTTATAHGWSDTQTVKIYYQTAPTGSMAPITRWI